MHTFHIPVMGLGFTIDTPIKVGHFGISSVISIIEDHLIEQMREVISRNNNFSYKPIPEDEEDSRAKRITAYLNLINFVVDRKTHEVANQNFTPGTDLYKYFELLPEQSEPRQRFAKLAKQTGIERTTSEDQLRT